MQAIAIHTSHFYFTHPLLFFLSFKLHKYPYFPHTLPSYQPSNPTPPTSFFVNHFPQPHPHRSSSFFGILVCISSDVFFLNGDDLFFSGQSLHYFSSSCFQKFVFGIQINEFRKLIFRMNFFFRFQGFQKLDSTIHYFCVPKTNF